LPVTLGERGGGGVGLREAGAERADLREGEAGRAEELLGLRGDGVERARGEPLHGLARVGPQAAGEAQRALPVAGAEGGLGVEGGGQAIAEGGDLLRGEAVVAGEGGQRGADLPGGGGGEGVVGAGGGGGGAGRRGGRGHAEDAVDEG